jgi:hypothetical protein
LGDQTAWARARAIKAYIGAADSYDYSVFYGENYPNVEETSDQEIVGAFGSNGFTPNAFSKDNTQWQFTTSIDISSYLTQPGTYRIILNSGWDYHYDSNHYPYLTETINGTTTTKTSFNPNDYTIGESACAYWSAQYTGDVLSTITIYGYQSINE